MRHRLTIIGKYTFLYEFRSMVKYGGVSPTPVGFGKIASQAGCS